MNKLKAILAILRGQPISLPAGYLSPEAREQLVKILETKAVGAQLNQVNFPVEQFPQAYGRFVGREQAFREAMAEVNNA